MSFSDDILRWGSIFFNANRSRCVTSNEVNFNSFQTWIPSSSKKLKWISSPQKDKSKWLRFFATAATILIKFWLRMTFYVVGQTMTWFSSGGEKDGFQQGSKKIHFTFFAKESCLQGVSVWTEFLAILPLNKLNFHFWIPVKVTFATFQRFSFAAHTQDAKETQIYQNKECVSCVTGSSLLFWFVISNRIAIPLFLCGKMCQQQRYTKQTVYCSKPSLRTFARSQMRSVHWPTFFANIIWSSKLTTGLVECRVLGLGWSAVKSHLLFSKIVILCKTRLQFLSVCDIEIYSQFLMAHT